MAAEKTIRIALSGYYGVHNSGDEAVLNSILTALEHAGQERGVKIEPIVLSGDPAVTTKLYGVRAVHRMKPKDVWSALRECDGLISGGGSLLQDATSPKTIPYYIGIIKLAQWLRKPTFIYAQGIGPVGRKAFFPLIRNAFKRAKLITVRDAESRELLGTMGLNMEQIHVVPDPVMGIKLPDKKRLPAITDANELPLVGVSVRFWKEDRSDLKQIAATLKALMKRQPLHLRFLPFHGEADEAASRFIMQELGGAVPSTGSHMSIAPAYEHPLDMVAEVARCDTMIGMRLHAIIYAASQRVPVLGISYDPKIDQFLHRLGEQAIGSTDAMEPEQAADRIAAVLGNLASWRSDHADQIDRLVAEAEQPAQHILRLLRP